MLEPRSAHLSLALSVLALTTATAAAQTVHVVDDEPGPGVHFTSLSAALLAAGDGDVVLVKPGEYFADTAVFPAGGKQFEIVGKSLDVIADTGGRVRLRQGSLSITGLSAGQTVSLVGLEFPDSGLSAYQNEGIVHVKRCEFPPFRSESAPPTPWRTIYVGDSAAFLLEDCVVEGFVTPTPFGATSGWGLSIENSSVYLHETTVRGAKGLPSKDGSDAVFMQGGHLYASGSLLLGGQAGDVSSFFPSCGLGGDGIELRDGAVAEVAASTVVGGPGGNGCPEAGSESGKPVEDFGGTYVVLDVLYEGSFGPAGKGIEVTSPVREGQTAFLYASGQRNDDVFVMSSAATVVNPLSAVPGALFVDPALLFVDHLGKLIHTGSGAYALPTIPLAPGVQAQTVSLQLAFVGFTGELSLSGLSRLVVLDSAF